MIDEFFPRNMFWLLTAVTVAVYIYYKWSFNYWKSRGVPTLETSIPMGNAPPILFRKQHLTEHLKGLYNTLKRNGHRHGGIYFATSKVYMPVDPEIVRCILSKDFPHFVDRGLFDASDNNSPISRHLFAVDGHTWKNMRQKLTPTFSSGKMKQMFETVLECGNALNESLKKKVDEGHREVFIKDFLASYSLDIIGSCAFGLEFNAMKDPSSPFRKYAKRTTESSLRTTILTSARLISPKLSSLLRFFIGKTDVADFFQKLVKDTVDYRETKGFTRKDFMQLLVDLKNSTDGENITMDEVTANTLLFFVAGFETSSTAMSFCLLELSRNRHIQNRVRKEIRDVLKKHEGKLTYDAVSEMKYLGQVFDETLRLFPSLAMLNRKCVKDWKVPDSDIVIERGTSIVIPVTGLQHDPEFYENPEKFDPERFSEENKSKIRPFTYLPFGDGPRNCIGLRFGIMQSKVGLASLLKDFEFSLSDTTEVPIKLNPNGFFVSVKGGLWLDAKRVD